MSKETADEIEIDEPSFIYKYNPEIHKVKIYYRPEDRRTSEIMTKFEYTEAVSIRAKQIENGGTCFTDTTGITNPIAMAEKEIADKKSPLDLVRKITDIHMERWHVNEMTIPQL